MGQKHTTHGFTLVETLIAMVLLSLLMISGAMAYDYFSQNWQRNKGLADTTLERHHLLSLVQRVGANSFPKVVRKDEERLGFYFLGRENGFTAVARMSVQNPDATAVYRIFREQNGRGGFRLVYEEAVLDELYLTDPDQELPFNFRRILYHDVDVIEFRYFGYGSLRERNQSLSPDLGDEYEMRWFTEYDGLERVLHPQVVHINLNGFNWSIEVPDAIDHVLARYTSGS